MGWDYKEDGELQSYMPSYMAQFGKPQGLPSLRPLFNKLMGKTLSDVELCEEGYKDLQWFVSQDPDCLSNAIFADNQHSEHKGFNVGQLAYEHLYTLLGQQKPMASIPVPTPEPTFPDFALLPYRVRTLKQSNIRKTPEGELLSSTAITTEWQDAMMSVQTWQGQDFAWARIELNGLSGWVAKTTNFEYELIEVVPPPPPKRYLVNINNVQIEVSLAELDSLIANAELELEALKTAKLDKIPF